jgi:putative redox protein
MEVEVDAQQKNNAATITDLHFILTIETKEERQKIEKCLEHTINTCPVGILFKQAGINITNEIKML